jgi:hypothetical protein
LVILDEDAVTRHRRALQRGRNSIDVNQAAVPRTI